MRSLCSLIALAAATAYSQTNFQQQVASTAVQQRPDLQGVRVEQKMGAQLPLQATFTDDTGKLVTLGQLIGKRPVVLLPIFFRCQGVCDTELKGIVNALNKDSELTPGQNVDVAVLSVDPQENWKLGRDRKSAALVDYDRPKSAGGWHFLNGDMGNIRAVTDAMGFDFTYDAKRDIVNHPSCIAIITPQGRVSAYMLSGAYAPAALTRDVALASKSGIAPKSEELYFGCVHVDPITGKRSLVIQTVLKLLGLVTVAGILIGIISMARVNRAGPVRAS